jgi:hypothetical protein
MRTMLKISILPSERNTKAIGAGALGKAVGAFAQVHKPEASTSRWRLR